MKLVEILAMELEEWPSKRCVCIAQDKNRDVYGWSDKPTFDNGDWLVTDTANVVDRVDEKPFLRATDYKTAIVTRADWEAERAKLKAPKADADGWIRHRGGKCPVEAGVLVEVRNRAGDIALKDGDSCTSVSWHWSHDKHPGDIMVYKIHVPAEQPPLVSEETIKAAEPGKFDALAIRDRIRALDTQRAEVESTYQRQISEITQERGELVQKLAGEGLALVEVVVQSIEGMSDWRNWEVGDLIEWVGVMSRNYTVGNTYEVEQVLGVGLVMDDNNGGGHNWRGDQAIANVFKWHSRPAS